MKVLEFIIRDDTNARDSHSAVSVVWNGKDYNN